MKKRFCAFLAVCIMLLSILSAFGTAAAQAAPYRVKIDWDNTPIFNGPGYDYNHVGDVGEAGIYTILQEVWDIEGYVWGQLKSGAGWVNLSDIIGAVKIPPYIQRVPEADQPVYEGAGYSFRQVGTVEIAANYTIVEEKYDAYGSLWGRLKSGKGWIDLTDVLIDEWDFVPYVTHIPDPNHPIYEGPGYEYAYVGTVEKAADYTIIEEWYDDNGELWGKLKSGKGWINLMFSNAVCEVEPYLQTVRRADQPIFSAPSYDATYEGIVQEAGTYTITAEAWDMEGNLWGRLKSGRGWVNLTDIENDKINPTPVSAGYADENLLLHADYEEYIGEDEEIAAYVAFRVYEDISDVALTSLVWNEYSYEADRILHTIDLLEAGQPFVAALPFYGDMTAYGLSFTDSDNTEHFYAVTISMRNGMIEFNEYIP